MLGEYRGKFSSFNCSNCFPNPLLSSVPWLAVLIVSFIVGTRHIVLVSTIIRSTRHAVVVYVHAVSVRPTVPDGVINMFPIDPLGRPICRRFCLPQYIQGINPHRRLLELLGQVRNGSGEVGYGLALGHHCVPLCCRCCCQVNGGVVGVLPSFSEVVRDGVSL